MILIDGKVIAEQVKAEIFFNRFIFRHLFNKAVRWYRKFVEITNLIENHGGSGGGENRSKKLKCRFSGNGRERAIQDERVLFLKRAHSFFFTVTIKISNRLNGSLKKLIDYPFPLPFPETEVGIRFKREIC